MIASDFSNAFECQISGKLDIGFGLKAGLEFYQRFGRRFRAYFAKQIHRGGADIDMWILFDDFDQPSLRLRVSLGVEDIDDKDSYIRIGIGQQRLQNGIHFIPELLRSEEHTSE